jgi:hypothetical protein
MQVNKSQIIKQKKSQEKIEKIQKGNSRPVSAAAAPKRNEYNFRFNSKFKLPKK